MVQFEVPAIVPADPKANVTDLLVARVKATPSGVWRAAPSSSVPISWVVCSPICS